MWAAGARWIAVACGALVAGAALGFVARYLLGLEQPAVAIAWVAGAVAGLAAELGRERRAPRQDAGGGAT